MLTMPFPLPWLTVKCTSSTHHKGMTLSLVSLSPCRLKELASDHELGLRIRRQVGACLPASRSVCLSVYLPVWSACLVCLSICLSACLSVCLPPCLSVCLSASLFACLSFSLPLCLTSAGPAELSPQCQRCGASPQETSEPPTLLTYLLTHPPPPPPPPPPPLPPQGQRYKGPGGLIAAATKIQVWTEGK